MYVSYAFINGTLVTKDNYSKKLNSLHKLHLSTRSEGKLERNHRTDIL